VGSSGEGRGQGRVWVLCGPGKQILICLCTFLCFEGDLTSFVEWIVRLYLAASCNQRKKIPAVKRLFRMSWCPYSVRHGCLLALLQYRVQHGILELPPSSSGLRGIIGLNALKALSMLRAKGYKLIVVSGGVYAIDCTLLFKQLIVLSSSVAFATSCIFTASLLTNKQELDLQRY
jgi:hypothetical protein